MPFPDPLLPVVAVVAAVAGFSVWLCNRGSSASAAVRNTHTRFAMSQMVEELDRLGERDFPRSQAGLLAVLKVLPIDWNRCSIEGGEVLDGWGRPVVVEFDESDGRWTFRSSGVDGRIGTEDDIETATERVR